VLSVSDARARLIGAVQALTAEEVPIGAALDRVAAEPIHAIRDQPPFAASAMDGYAFRAENAPCSYTLVGESAAGSAFTRTLAPGEAVRISTGAPLPLGADTVLAQEDAKVEHGRLIGANSRAGRHVRQRAGDFAAGAVLLEKGRKLDPVALALAASAGRDRLKVTREPRVEIMAGGDEVVAPGGDVRDDQVFESGSFAVCGLAEKWGGRATRGAILPDNQASIETAALAALARSDLLVLIGGASVGPHDHARAALEQLGFVIQFDKVSVRPGKPTWFGVSPHGKVLGLPGNPASAIVCSILFLKPIIDAMLGAQATFAPVTRRAPLAHALSANGARESYLRARLDADDRLRVFDDQDSSLLSVFAHANALIQRPANTGPAAEGELIPYLSLDF
jgi:molybdopterin molybdotransferase